MHKAGHYETMRDNLGPWLESINYGLSTFVEENSYWRSMCHAWSAHPILEFQQRILGVTPVKPGYEAIEIRPHVCGLTHASGSVCTPLGLIEVSWKIEDGKFALQTNVPTGIETKIIAPDGQIHTNTGGEFAETFSIA
jgi:hypothetical protein